MWAFRRTLPESWNIIAVQAPIADPVGGFSWWLVDPAPVSLLEVACAASDLVFKFLHAALAHYKLAPQFMVAMGFSQGAGTLSVLVQRHPALFSGVGLLAGFVVETAPIEAQLIPAPNILIAHGAEDQVVPVQTARKGAEYLKARGAKVQMIEDPVGHKIGTGAMRALAGGGWYGAQVG